MAVDRHDWHAEGYVEDWVSRSQSDEARRQARFQLMTRLIGTDRDAAIRILDIGAGYGALTKIFLDAFPKATVVALDYSGPMLARARDTLASYGGRVPFVSCDLSSKTWTHDLEQQAGGERFDAAVSSIAIHNLRSAPRVRQLYREIFDLLRDRGCFLNVDLMNAPSKELQDIYWRCMAESSHVAGHLINSDPYRHVRGEWPPFPASLEEQLAWLREAGFKNVDCFWKETAQALVGGWK